ncbi:uncharacterized protein FIBRA_07407 [Fibroporia radiculosa]|uniref:Ima1 N-terminal domain-containing protein n=1 Tax=Fibroporia radiculosa TaxID=599839 RepID=J4GEC5_9APHY|nr:uncharacterized protein FIBRA_07407 [Fibroporia radiculosa]CCM05198.1 predicted protein [Fibroporia radiculosa]
MSRPTVLTSDLTSGLHLLPTPPASPPQWRSSLGRTALPPAFIVNLRLFRLPEIFILFGVRTATAGTVICKARKDRLPSVYGSGMFCHTCQTNQMLLSNLLSSYLPPPDDLEYEQRAALLPEYKRSIEARYPPICADCAPAVEEEIRKRDHMAQTRALGAFLRESNPTRRNTTQTQYEKDRLSREIVLWRIRGVLWMASLFGTLGAHSAVASGYWTTPIPGYWKIALPLITSLSLLWTAWDPTYASLRKAQFQGRAIRQRGKKEYNILQFGAWLARCLTSSIFVWSWYKPDWVLSPSSVKTYSFVSLGFELLIVAFSCLVLRLERPPPVRLATDPSGSLAALASAPASRSITPTVESDLLAPLTLSQKPFTVAPPPSASTTAPIFGLPSLTTASRSSSAPPQTDVFTSMEIEDDDDIHGLSSHKDPNAMDWSPIRPSSSRNINSRFGQDSDGGLLRPQRFFAPEEPTGLENLFAETINLADDNELGDAQVDGCKSKPVQLVVATVSTFFFTVLVLCSSFITTTLLSDDGETSYLYGFHSPFDTIQNLVRATIRIFVDDSLLDESVLGGSRCYPMATNVRPLGKPPGLLKRLVGRFLLGLPVVGAGSIAHMLFSVPLPFHWVRFRANNRGRESRDVVTLLVVAMVLMGAARALYKVFRLTEGLAKRLLLRAEDAILEVA